jgi:SPP1 gp7 family putative phage head morphogenesis protein
VFPENSPLEFGVNWDLANDDAARWSLEYAAELVRGIEQTTQARLQREISNWIENGETLPDLQRRLAPMFGETRAELIAATEVTRAFAEGNQAAWRESGVVQRHRWNTANDELVCLICGPLNGEVTEIGKPFPNTNIIAPPAHPRCRCWLTPVVEIPDDETPQERFERQQAEKRQRIENAERWLMENIPGMESVDYSGVGPDIAELINERMLWAKDNNYLGNIKRIVSSNKSGNAFMSIKNGNELVINKLTSEMFAQIKRSTAISQGRANYCIAYQKTSEEVAKILVDHEIGHLVQYERVQLAWFDNPAQRAAKKAFRAWGRLKYNEMEELSIYSKANIASTQGPPAFRVTMNEELFAEAFAAFHNDVPLPEKVERLLIDILNIDNSYLVPRERR